MKSDVDTRLASKQQLGTVRVKRRRRRRIVARQEHRKLFMVDSQRRGVSRQSDRAREKHKLAEADVQPGSRNEAVQLHERAIRTIQSGELG